MPDNSQAAIAKEYGTTSLEAMLHDGKMPYLHMVRRYALESPISIRQFRREWFAALNLLFGKAPIPADLGVDTTGANTYWARLKIGMKEGEWVYRLSVSREALLSPAVHRTEIIAHEAAHLLYYYNEYVKKGQVQGREAARLAARFDFLDHGPEWQEIFRGFYAKLKVAGVVEEKSEYEKHAAELLEAYRKVKADPDWIESYKARIKAEQKANAKDKTKAGAKPPKVGSGRVKPHRRRTKKGKKVSVQGYQRKPRR